MERETLNGKKEELKWLQRLKIFLDIPVAQI